MASLEITPKNTHGEREEWGGGPEKVERASEDVADRADEPPGFRVVLLQHNACELPWGIVRVPVVPDGRLREGQGRGLPNATGETAAP